MSSRPMAFALALPLLCAACAETYTTPTDLPAGLEAPEGETLSFVAEAEGFQIYDCKLTDGAYTWTFRAPDATLYAACEDGEDCALDEVVGTHYAGPTWESTSGSTVVGMVELDVASPDADSVPWLRLSAVSNSGEGPFEAVKTIQRLYTSGGKAPAEGCDEGSVDAEHDAPYTATYYFYQ